MRWPAEQQDRTRKFQIVGKLGNDSIRLEKPGVVAVDEYHDFPAGRFGYRLCQTLEKVIPRQGDDILNRDMFVFISSGFELE